MTSAWRKWITIGRRRNGWSRPHGRSEPFFPHRQERQGPPHERRTQSVRRRQTGGTSSAARAVRRDSRDVAADQSGGAERQTKASGRPGDFSGHHGGPGCSPGHVQSPVDLDGVQCHEHRGTGAGDDEPGRRPPETIQSKPGSIAAWRRCSRLPAPATNSGNRLSPTSIYFRTRNMRRRMSSAHWLAEPTLLATSILRRSRSKKPWNTCADITASISTTPAILTPAPLDLPTIPGCTADNTAAFFKLLPQNASSRLPSAIPRRYLAADKCP